MNYIFEGRPSEYITSKSRVGKTFKTKTLGQFNSNGIFVTKNKELAKKLLTKFKYHKDVKKLDWGKLRSLASDLGVLEKGMKKAEVLKALKKI